MSHKNFLKEAKQHSTNNYVEQQISKKTRQNNLMNTNGAYKSRLEITTLFKTLGKGSKFNRFLEVVNEHNLEF